MKNKFIKILILMSIFSLSLVKGSTHFSGMYNMNIYADNTMSHCSKKDTTSLKNNIDICKFVCHLIFIHTNTSDNNLVAYQTSFSFKSNFHLRKLINIFKPPIYI
jgi:hypothetical protein